MNALTQYGRTDPIAILQEQRQEVATSSFSDKIISDLPIIFLFKTGGGVGADIMVSLMDNCLRDAVKQEAYVLQIGGTRGPVAHSHPSQLYDRIELDRPDPTAAMIDAIGEKFERHPIIVVVDPNYSARLIEDLEDLRVSGIKYNARGMVLLRDANETPKILNHLVRAMPHWKAMVEPQFERSDPNLGIIVPRLPPIMISRIVEKKISVRQALDEQSAGTIAMLLGKLKRFNLMMEGVYVHA